MIDEDKFKRRIEKARQSKQRSYERHIHRLKDNPEYRVRDALNSMRFSNRSGSHINCLRYHKQNTDLHERTKFEVFKKLVDEGHQVMTEAIFAEGEGRADIVDCCCNIIYEVLVSESEKKLSEKEGKYPAIFEIRKIDAKTWNSEDIL